MNSIPDSAELAPSRDPAAYARRPLLGGVFWLMMGFCALCLLAAAAVAILGPKLAPVRQAAALAPAGSAAAAAPPPLAQDLAVPAIAGTPDLAARVQHLETDQGRIAAAAAEALSAAALSDAASRPAPFPAELAAAARLAPSSSDLMALSPLAQEGAPTRAALAAELTDLAAQISTAARAPGRDASFVDRMLYVVSRVVSLRRLDAGASGPDAALLKAERAAEDGNLERAAMLLDSLPDSAKAVLAAWREKAQRRIAIDQHIAGLRAQAMADLTAAQGGVPVALPRPASAEPAPATP